MLRRTAADLGAELIVIGGFGHSRLRERFFGGATTDMISGGGAGADGALSSAGRSARPRERPAQAARATSWPASRAARRSRRRWPRRGPRGRSRSSRRGRS